MLSLFAIIVIGSILGKLSFAGFGLKTAGVLITAMFFGHYGYSIPSGVSELGLLLFLYAVGLQAGGKFFRYFRLRPKVFFVLGIFPILIGATCIYALKIYTDNPAPLLLGLFSGALTNTPSLASTIDYFSGPSSDAGQIVSVGYGVAYPFGMLGTAIFIQFLPGILRRDLKDDAALEDKKLNKELVVKHFRVTNPNCIGLSLKELDPRRIAGANISRITRKGDVMVSSPQFKLEKDDIITAVCDDSKVTALKVMFGEEVTDTMALGQDIQVVDLEVSLSELTGKSLGEISFVSKYDVIITRVRRQGVEFAPSASTVLDFADIIRVVGKKEDIRRFSVLLGRESSRVQETKMLPFIGGIFIGTLLGSVPVSLGAVNFELGLSGGCFLVALVLGHFGKIGRLKVYVPRAASNLCRELGIILFMAGAGVAAGANFLSTISSIGYMPIILAGGITLLYIFVTFILAYTLFNRNLLYALGLVCGVANNSLPLNYLKEASKSDYASFAYATIYPVSLIAKIIAAQVLLKVMI